MRQNSTKPELNYVPNFPTLETQAQNLASALQGFEPKWRKDATEMIIPQRADGIAIWPTIKALGKYWGIENSYLRIGEITKETCGTIHEIANRYRSKFLNYFPQNLRRLRINSDVMNLLESLEGEVDKQGINCLALPISFAEQGLRFCRNPRDVRWHTLNVEPKRLCLGGAQVGCLLLAIPEWLQVDKRFQIDCPADEYDLGANGIWRGSSIFFSLFEHLIGFEANNWIDHNPDYGFDYAGPAVAFL